MRKGIVAGNWKMHGTRASTDGLLTAIKERSSHRKDCEVAVFPPFVFLDRAVQSLKDTSIVCGAQTLSEHEEGAFTGEISAEMIYDMGCRYVLVGHSERRILFGENDAQVVQKFVKVLRAGLRPVLCVGETLAQHRAGETNQVIKKQVRVALSAVESLSDLVDTVIAYEPVWAIGTGQTATPEQAQDVHALIRSEVAALSAEVADEVRILYGGSVQPTNAAALFSMPDIDGGLVGGASLSADSFLEIINAWPH